MISPRFSEINGQKVREQTLDEYLSSLDQEHCARQQLGELRDTIASQMATAQAFEEQKLDLMRKVDTLNTKLTKAYEDLKGAYERLKVYDDHTKRSEASRALPAKIQEKREAKRRAEGDAGDQL